MLYTMEYVENPESNVVVKKEEIQTRLSTIIGNGGDLDAVKHAYVTRNKEKEVVYHTPRQRLLLSL